MLTGCSMERVPASIDRNTVVVETPDIARCSWRSLPKTRTLLIPGAKKITCDLVGHLKPESMEFSFIETLGKIQAKHSRKFATTFELTTGEHGAIYHLEYKSKENFRDCIGRWCGWSQAIDVPTVKELLPDDEGVVHVESDGGLIYRAMWKTDVQRKGLVFLYCGLGGMQHASTVLMEELITDGWIVVSIFTVINAPDYKTNMTLMATPYTETIIELFDSKYCQVIEATKAIQNHLEQELPVILPLPLVLIGISAGALNTPAVFHELQNDVDAVVLIAGGANMLDIVQNGAFTKWRFSGQDGFLSKDELEQIETEYLKTISRDPYFLAQELPENTLLVHAKWDAIVPAVNGDLLWERAGRPERWIFSGGHLGLFMTFSWHVSDIAQWIDSKTTQQSLN